jgi:ATP-dependent Clp protease protease subunit
MAETPEEKMIEENLKENKEKKKKGIFFVNNTFTDGLLEYIFLDLKKAIDDKNIEEITIYINSNGGQVSTLFPLVDLIDSSETPINTIVLGKAYSAGAMLLLSGTKGHRSAYKHANILLHEVANDFGYAKSSQTKENSIHLDRINKELIKMVREKTKMKPAEIDRYFNSNKDIFISANQALKYKIIDKII